MKEEYLAKMQELLKEEYPAYLEELKKSPTIGLRYNLLKTDASILETLPVQVTKSPFTQNGYTIAEKAGIGSSWMHAAGLLYFQEPSASSAVTVLDPKPGMKILDLCAAPGSKTTQIAERMQNEGLLVANEIHPRRVQILKENIERWGAGNVIVLNSDSKDIAKTFPDFFDAILVDAPCSGEGMMRKEEDAERMWSQENVEACASRQAMILDQAYQCLKLGGTLVYSTCTFAKEENEMNVAAFVERHPDMQVCPIENLSARNGLDFGHHTEYAHRIYPMDGGEGHFVCKMQKAEAEYHETKLSLMKSDPVAKEAVTFMKQNFANPFPYMFQYKNIVYGGVNPFIDCGRCRLVRHQVQLGTMKNGRFEPSHALYLSSYLKPLHTVSLTEEQAKAFMKGETINQECAKGYVAVTVNGYVLGFGKSDGRIIKNHFPKEYRIR